MVFPPSPPCAPQPASATAWDWDPDGQRELRKGLRRRDCCLSPWRWFTCGPLVQNRCKEKYGEPTRAIAGAGLSIDYSYVQSASVLLLQVCMYKYARRMRTVHHAGTRRQLIPTYTDGIYQVGNISPGGLVVRQAATLQATCSPQVACRASHLPPYLIHGSYTWR